MSWATLLEAALLRDAEGKDSQVGDKEREDLAPATAVMKGNARRGSGDRKEKGIVKLWKMYAWIVVTSKDYFRGERGKGEKQTRSRIRGEKENA